MDEDYLSRSCYVHLKSELFSKVGPLVERGHKILGIFMLCNSSRDLKDQYLFV